MSAHVELHFPVLGNTLPVHHGYALYGALSRKVPALHATDSPISIGPIGGDYLGRGLMQLGPRSRLRCRLPTDAIATLLPLAGQSFDVAGHSIRLKIPQVLPLIPAPNLVARMVTMKKSNRQESGRTRDYMDPAAFLDAIRRHLTASGIHGEPGIPLVQEGPHAGKPRRHVLRVKDQRIIGYTLQVAALTAEESIQLQEQGIGGRRKMGCGFFMPLKPR